MRPTPKQIRLLVEQAYGLDLKEKNRLQRYVTARKIYFILSRRYTNATITAIANEIGFHHSLAIHHTKDQDVFNMNYPEARAPMGWVVEQVEKMIAVEGYESAACSVLKEMEALTALGAPCS